MEESIVDLQTRLAFQEAGLEELTLTVVRQQRTIEQLGQELERLRRQLRAAVESNILAPHEDTPPPHY